MENKDEKKPPYELVKPAELLMNFRNGHLQEYLSALVSVRTVKLMKPDAIFKEQVVQIAPGQLMKQKQTVKEALPVFEDTAKRNFDTLTQIDALLVEYGYADQLKAVKLNEQK